jgi:hypothetical protein
MQQVYAKRKQKKAALIPHDIDPLRQFEQFRQFGDVVCNASLLVHGEHVDRTLGSDFATMVDVGKRLTVRILHFAAARDLFNRPRWRKASLRHGINYVRCKLRPPISG